jgi:hypothetical protein
LKSADVKVSRRVFRKISIRAVSESAIIARSSFFTQRRKFVQNIFFADLARNANYTYFNADVNIKKRPLTLRDRYFLFFIPTLTRFSGNARAVSKPWRPLPFFFALLRPAP